MPTSNAAFAVPVIFGLCASESNSATVAANIQSRPALCKYRRIDCNWWTNQGNGPPSGTKPGGWDTLTSTALDNTVSAAAVAKNKLVLVVGYTPPWAGGDGISGHNFPVDAANGYRDFANFVYVAATRCEKKHPGTVIAWEIWNEPQNGFLNPISITNYGYMLETVYILCRTGVLTGRTTRTALPSTVQIWSGGTGAFPAVGSPNRHLNWSRTLLQRPVRCLDGVSIHDYSGGCPLGTVNGYDPATNDIPGIAAAITSSTWASAANPAIQIHDTESGYFWRDDTTSTQSDCGDKCNCNSYGTGPNPNEKLEVTVTTAALRLKQSWNWWQNHASTYPLGAKFYYQQDTTAPNNNDGGAWANHAGLYIYSTSRLGTPTLDVHNASAILDAYNKAQAAPLPPTLTSISPLSGTTAGGNTATLVGTNLTGVSVSFGTKGATNVVVASDGLSLTCTVPSHTNAVTLHVTATDLAGTSNPLNYQYLIPVSGRPTVTGVSPISGPIAGGSAVTLTGTNFASVDPAVLANVMFGVDAAGAISVVSDTQIVATTPIPLSTPGVLDITVTNSSGTSVATTADQFTVIGVAPSFQIVAIQLADGTVYQTFTTPPVVSGVISVTWSATTDNGIQSTWLETGAGVFLATGISGSGLYGCSYDTTLQSDGDLVIRPNGLDIDAQSPATFNPVTIDISNATSTGVGYFAAPFFTDYTTHDGTSPPTVGITSAVPNPLP